MKSKRKKEIELEIPEFPKPPAPALRFGSMNPISRVWGHGSIGESCNGPNPAWYLGKSYNLRGAFFFFLIAEMEFRPIIGSFRPACYGSKFRFRNKY